MLSILANVHLAAGQIPPGFWRFAATTLIATTLMLPACCRLLDAIAASLGMAQLRNRRFNLPDHEAFPEDYEIFD